MCYTAVSTQNSSSLSESLFTRVKREAWQQIVLGSPVTLTMILKSAVSVISVIFVGHIGSSELAAAALATLTSNVTGNSLIVGMSGALSTLCAQAYGAKDYDSLGITLQRALLIIYCTCIPVSILWFCSEPIFVALGQSPQVAASAAEYMTLLIPFLWANAGVQSLQSWLYSMGRSSAVGIAAAVVALLHAPFCYLFIYTFGMGFRGAAVAVSASGVALLASILGYIWWYDLLKETQFQFSRRCLSDWWPYFAIALPNLLMMSEWWACEAMVFMAGSLTNPEVQLAAMSVYQTTNSLSFMVPQGFHVAAAAHVGNALGAGTPEAAKLSAMVAPVGAGLMNTITAVLLFTFSDEWARLFTNDEDVARISAHLFRIMWYYFIVDAVQCALTGVLKGAGRQNFGGPVVFASYYVVGLPLGACLAFQWGLGLGMIGLLLGNSAGTFTHTIVYAVCCWKMDWEGEVVNTKKRLQGLHSSSTDSLSLDEGDDLDLEIEFSAKLHAISKTPSSGDEDVADSPSAWQWISSLWRKPQGYNVIQRDTRDTEFSIVGEVDNADDEL